MAQARASPRIQVPWRFYLGAVAAATLAGLLSAWTLGHAPAVASADAAALATPYPEVRSPTLYSPIVGTPIPTLAAATVAVCADKKEPGYGLIDPCAPPASTYPLAPGG